MYKENCNFSVVSKVTFTTVYHLILYYYTILREPKMNQHYGIQL